jgi:hypothetical protein
MGEQDQSASVLMTAEQRIVAGVISVVAAIFIGVRFWSPRFPVDSTTFSLLALGVLPWLTLFFKRVNIPGIGEAETRFRVSRLVRMPLPRLPTEPIHAASAENNESGLPTQFRALPDSAKKVLRTLWHNQDKHGSDSGLCWTFAILPDDEQFVAYLSGLAALLEAGLVAIAGDENLCGLTAKGVAMMSLIPVAERAGDVYVL